MSSVRRAALAALIPIIAILTGPAAAQAVSRAPPAPPPAPPAPRLTDRAATPQWPLVSLISPDDYPQAAIDALEQGEVTVELGVTAEGRVGTCRILKSSDSVALDTVTCRVLTRRARFRPARDSIGQRVGDRVTQRIRWELDSLRFAPLAAISIGRTSDAGVVVTCRDETLSRWCGDPQFDLSMMTIVLTGKVMRSADLVRTMTFTPGNQPLPAVAGVARAGDRPLYSGSARVTISRNGKVRQCVELSRTGGPSGGLCEIAREWLFKVDPDGDETRAGVWNVTLGARPPLPAK